MSFEDNQLSKWLAMAEVTAKRTVAKQTNERARSGVCLCCDKKAERRGLCFSHYFQFYRKMKELPKSKRSAFEEHHIREGNILATGQICEIKSNSPFKDAS